MFRYDDDLLISPYVWGRPTSANPLLHLLHLRRAGTAGWFGTYAQIFEAVRATARRWTLDREGPSPHGQD